MFDVLHWVKAAFKKHALDDIKESDCLNKEAFRCVPHLSLPHVRMLTFTLRLYVRRLCATRRS